MDAAMTLRRLSQIGNAGRRIIRIEQKIPPLARRLISDLVWKITRNEIEAGAQLPSIEEIARQYDAGRSTVREALRFVESTGLVETHQGRGTFILDFAAGHTGLTFFDQIVDLRKMLELHATSKAVERRTRADLDLMAALLEEMRRTRTDYQRFIDADRAFHGAIINASGNPLLPGVFNNVSGVFLGVQNALINIDPDVQENSIAQHQDILEAIERQELAAALSHTERHLDMISSLFRQHSL